MLTQNLIYVDLQDSLQIANVTVPFADYLRRSRVAVEVTRRCVKLKKLALNQNVDTEDQDFFDECEEFSMPRNILFRPESCTVRLASIIFF